MKTKFNQIIRSLAFAAAFAAGLGVTVKAEEPMKPMKGGEHMLMMKGADSKEQVDALKPGDSLAMVCAKCKTVWVTKVLQGV